MSDAQDSAAELAAIWAEEMRRTGGVRVPYSGDDELAHLRDAGRRVAELLARPITTTARHGVLHVLLADWGTNPLEQRLEDARTRNAIDRAFDADVREHGPL